MKKFLLLAFMMLCTFSAISAQSKAEIKFDQITHNFGKFSETEPIQKCVFTFTNVGGAPLVINQAVASCGCMVPNYTKTPVAPGEKGKLEITYNGKGKFPGHFKKTITVRTNGETEAVRLYVEGIMEEKE